jgi:tetratricopeptide (TPR) repeat protein
MFKEEFMKLRENIGNLLSFNNLLSTSTNRDVSVRFAQHSLGKDGMVAVLFEMHIDPSIRSTPFALLNGISYFPAEEEILFSMHSVFRIQGIKQMHNHIWNIQLTLTGDDDPQLRQLTDFMRREIRGPNATHRLASYMLKVQEWDKAKEIFEVLHRDVSPERKDELAYIEYSLGKIYDEKGDLERALTHYQKSLDIEMTYLPSDHPQLGPTYSSLACLYEKQGKFDLAMEQYRHSLTIELNSPFPDKLRIASRYMNMGDLLRQLGRLDEARKSVNAALKIQLEILPPIHPNLAVTYGHLFDICFSMKDYPSALEQAKEELRISQRSYPANDMGIAISHNHVAISLGMLDQYKEALKEAEKAVEIGRYTYPLGHPKMRAIDNSLAKLRRINTQLFGDH